MDQARIRELDYRAVFRDGSLTLLAHEPWMPRACGSARVMIRGHVVAVIADLEVVRCDDGGLELVVEEITATGDPAFRQALVAFAEGLGYRRLWIASDVIDLDPVFEHVNVTVRTTCPASQTAFTEDEVEFVLHARRIGVWPCRCPLDGYPLPQWQITTPDTSIRGCV